MESKLKSEKSEIENLLASFSTLTVEEIEHRLNKIPRSADPEPFSTLFRELFELDITETEAARHWRTIRKQHEDFRLVLGGKIDLRATALDYLTREANLIENAKISERARFEKLRQDTMTDALTGLHNVRQFNQVMEREISRADRYGSPLSILIMDLDFFKSVNDKYGHPIGDQVLRLTAEVITRSIRNSDLACRYGGEEFVVIAPETKKEDAVVVGERIRSAVEKVDLKTVQIPDRNLTISIGISSFPADGVSREALVRQADAALYVAKEAGRNRVESCARGPRRHARVPVKLQAVYSIADDYREQVLIREASEGGFLVEAAGALAPGGLVDLEVELADYDLAIRCQGKIVYLRKSSLPSRFNLGFAILQMASGDRNTYREFLLKPSSV